MSWPTYSKGKGNEDGITMFLKKQITNNEVALVAGVPIIWG